MTDKATHTPLPCPCCRSAEIENEHPDSPVYCRKCWLRAVSLTAWNTRADSHHRLVEALEDCVAVLTDPIVGTIYHDDPDWYQALDRAVTKARAALKDAGRG